MAPNMAALDPLRLLPSELLHDIGVIGHLADKTPSMKPPVKKHRFVICRVPFEVDVKYNPNKFLGAGSYGIVCSCLNIETGQSVAIKKIGDALCHRVNALRTLREIQILQRVRHENIISLEDVMLSGDKADFRHVYLVYEQMDTNLHELIKAPQRFSRVHSKCFLYQLLRGVNYLHSRNVIHRDLKPENVLVNANLVLKICDFGLSLTKCNEWQSMTEYVVTRWYRVPELLVGSSGYGKEVDMWSVGCIFAEMLGGKPIFPGANIIDQITKIMKVLGTHHDLSFIEDERSRKFIESLPKYSRLPCLYHLYPEADPLATDLLGKMLVLDPQKRISADDALRHPYFLGLYDEVSDSPSPFPVDLEIDYNPDKVGEETLRELIWEEMLFYCAA